MDRLDKTPKVPKEKRSRIDFFWIKSGFFVIITLLCVFGLFRVIDSFQKSAQEAQKLRAEKIANEFSDQKLALEMEVENYQEEIELIEGHFPTEGEILDLLVALQNLKNTGVITDSLITSDLAVKDKLGLYGLPVSVTITGDQNTINNALVALNDLPFLIRPVVFNLERLEDGSLTATYGGFVYTDEKFNQN